MTIEDRFRALIARHTLTRGQRASISRQLGHPRGWLTEYLSGKVKYLRIGELVQLLPLLHLDEEGRRELATLLAGDVHEDAAQRAQRVRLWMLWDAILPEHRAAVVHEAEQIAELSRAIARLSAQVLARIGRDRDDVDRLQLLRAEAYALGLGAHAERTRRGASTRPASPGDAAHASDVGDLPSTVRVPRRRRRR